MAIATLKCKQVFKEEVIQESSLSPEKTFYFVWVICSFSGHGKGHFMKEQHTS